MVCGCPSSSTRKFSFFSPGMMSPFCVAATTSSVTTGTSTETVTPASCGFCCCGAAGLCAGAVLSCPGEVGCGPAGACAQIPALPAAANRSEEHTSELQSHLNLVCRLLLEKKKKLTKTILIIKKKKTKKNKH